MKIFTQTLIATTTLAIPRWLSPYDFSQFEEQFSTLDLDRNSVVTVSEVIRGSSTAGGDLDGDLYIPESYTCIPTNEPGELTDCLTIAARKKYLRHGYSSSELSHPISFEEALTNYFGTCDDHLPPDAGEFQFCSDLVAHDISICYPGSEYCRVSCEHCPASHFNGHAVTGTDNIVKAYPDYAGMSDDRVVHNYAEYEDHQQNKRQLDFLDQMGVQKSTCNVRRGARGNVHVISDNHVEPWYGVSSSSFTGRYNRFTSPTPTASNMFQCRRSGNRVPCAINTSVNPPIELTEAAIDYLATRALNSDISRSLFIFAGDSQTHGITNGHSVSRRTTSPAIVDRTIRKLLEVGYRVENIIYAAGNHDPTFSSGPSSSSRAFTDVLQNRNIVTNTLGRSYSYGGTTYTTTQLLRQIGYYVKRLPSYFGAERYVIVVNTNLSRTHGLQQFALTQDLEWIRGRGGSVILVGHHPSRLPDMVSWSRFGSIIGAGISGHTHSWRASNSNRFVTAPPLTPMAPRPGLLVSTMGSDGRVTFGESQFHRYGGTNGKGSIANFVADYRCWGR